MSDWSDLTISGGTVTVVTYTVVSRIENGAPLPWIVHDDTHRGTQIRNYTLTPESGDEDNLTQILGGVEGHHIAIRTKSFGHTITLRHNSALLYLPDEVDIVLDHPRQVIHLVRMDTVDLYVAF